MVISTYVTDKLIKQLIELGLIPAQTQRVIIDIGMGRIATIYVQYLPDQDKLYKIDFVTGLQVLTNEKSTNTKATSPVMTGDGSVTGTGDMKND